MFLDRTGLHVQQGTNVSRDDWSGRTAGYTCLLERTGLDVQLGTHVSREDWSGRTAWVHSLDVQRGERTGLDVQLGTHG